MEDKLNDEDRYAEYRKKKQAEEENNNAFTFGANTDEGAAQEDNNDNITVGPERCTKGHKLIALKTPLLKPDEEDENSYSQVNTAICKFRNCKRFDNVEQGQNKKGLNEIDLTRETFYACQYDHCLQDVFAVHQECYGGPQQELIVEEETKGAEAGDEEEKYEEPDEIRSFIEDTKFEDSLSTNHKARTVDEHMFVRCYGNTSSNG